MPQASIRSAVVVGSAQAEHVQRMIAAFQDDWHVSGTEVTRKRETVHYEVDGTNTNQTESEFTVAPGRAQNVPPLVADLKSSPRGRQPCLGCYAG